MNNTDSDMSGIVHEKPYPIYVNGVKVCVHKPDFTIILKGGGSKVIEYKGQVKVMWKLKYKMFKAQYPDIPYEIVYHK